jgi:hypothetical protein
MFAERFLYSAHDEIVWLREDGSIGKTQGTLAATLPERNPANTPEALARGNPGGFSLTHPQPSVRTALRLAARGQRPAAEAGGGGSEAKNAFWTSYPLTPLIPHRSYTLPRDTTQDREVERSCGFTRSLPVLTPTKGLAAKNQTIGDSVPPGTPLPYLPNDIADRVTGGSGVH